MPLSGGFGALSFGRMPIFGSVLGANGLFRAIDPFVRELHDGLLHLERHRLHVDAR